MLTLASRHSLLCSSRRVVKVPRIRWFSDGYNSHGYVKVAESLIGDYNLKAMLLQHVNSGAQHVHIECDDKNNTFGVCFKTPQSDNTGLVHILEHLTLSGSSKYPCKDLFMKMTGRTVSSYMNAHTHPDYTAYPFTTFNAPDFHNLMSIYCDCLFNPLLTKRDFEQEGWRLEHADPKDPSSDIIVKGVVFNEMKGVMADYNSYYNHSFISNMLPKTYPYFFGGHPFEVPKLKYDTLLEFYHDHYHPSNALFYTYGNMPLEDHLKFLNEAVLRNYSRKEVKIGKAKENMWKEPRCCSVSGPSSGSGISNDSKEDLLQLSYSVGYQLRCDSLSEYYKMLLLSRMMVDPDSSPFQKSLISTKLGSTFCPNTGFHDYLNNTLFGIGLKGVSAENLERTEKAICDTFHQITDKGIDKELSFSIIKNLELGLRHKSRGFGRKIFSVLCSQWNVFNEISLQDISPLRYLQDFRTQIEKDEKYTAKLVEKYFSQNTHRLSITYNPDPNFVNKMIEMEKELNLSKTKLLSQKRRMEIFQSAQKVEEPVDESILPKLCKEDFSSTESATVSPDDEIYCGEDVPILYKVVNTNGVIYFKAMFDFSSLPEVLKAYVPLYCYLITRMGAGDMSYDNLNKEMLRTANEFSCSPLIVADPVESHKYSQTILISSYCLQEDLPQMFSLWSHILLRPNLNDASRLLTLLQEFVHQKDDEVIYSGHLYSIRAAASKMSSFGSTVEKLKGFSQIRFLKSLLETDVNQVIGQLANIQASIFSKAGMKCQLNVSAEDQPMCQLHVDNFLDLLPEATLTEISAYDHENDAGKDGFSASPNKTFIKFPSTVYYCSRAFPGTQYSHPDFACFQVLAQLLFNKYLHPEIREKGGAYGSGVRLLGDCITLFSYRDPNSLKTIRVFDGMLDWILQGMFSDVDIEQSIISVLGEMDTPLTPSEVGSDFFLQGITRDLKENLRKQLLAVDRNQLLQVSQKYFSQTNSTVVVGNYEKSLMEAKDWNVVDAFIN